MSAAPLDDSTAVVTGASRGFGRAISVALADAGAKVVGLARSAEQLQAVADRVGPSFTPYVADVADPAIADITLRRIEPDVLILNAGAVPPMSPIHEQTWDSFATNWEVDTRHVFEWLGASLRQPLRPGSVVITISSGAALGGSPLSGGYAPAKAAIRFISTYAAEESARAALGIGVHTLFPQLTPHTDLGSAGISGYAERQGVSVEELEGTLQPALTPEQVGAAVLDLIQRAPSGPQELLVSGRGVAGVR